MLTSASDKIIRVGVGVCFILAKFELSASTSATNPGWVVVPYCLLGMIFCVTRL